MEFIDDDWDSQPRARVVHSRSNAVANSSSSTTNPASRSVPHAAACAASAVLLLAAAYSLDASYQFFSSVLIWIAFSLLLAPFAPSSATGGDISVGRGSLLLDQEPPEESTPEPVATSRRGRRQNAAAPPPKSPDPIAPPIQMRATGQEATGAGAGATVLDGPGREEDVGEWTDQEMELLRRQMVKHPAGEPQRWEKIASVFGGRRTPESVIRAAKSGATAAAGGSFEQFLRKRKPLDPRAEVADADAGGNVGGGDGGDCGWSAGEDRALLNALKEFPKDTAMRWEKVAAAVPGKTKAGCMKRVTELKRDFRSSKAPSEAAP